MDRQDREAIESLFERLGEVERGAPARDAEADGFIRRRIAAQPGAPYFMAQTIVAQDQALKAAEARIAELEQGAEDRPRERSVWGGLFGGEDRPARRGMRVPNVSPGADRQGAEPQQRGQGGGFLAGAAQTAMGVAGGVLIGNLLTGALFGRDGGTESGGAEKQEASGEDDSKGDNLQEASYEDDSDAGDFDSLDI